MSNTSGTKNAWHQELNNYNECIEILKYHCVFIYIEMD